MGNYLHLNEGGTFMTNMEADTRSIAEAAIAKFGNKDVWIINEPSLDELSGSHYSLHTNLKETGPFWQIYDALSEEVKDANA